MRRWPVRFVLPALVVLDGAVTAIAVTFFGAAEVNPLCAAAISVSWWLFAAIKLTSAALSLLLLLTSTFWSTVVMVVYTALVVWNLGIIGYYVGQGT